MSILKFETRTPKTLAQMYQYLMDAEKTDERGLLGWGINPKKAVEEMEFTQMIYHKENLYHPYMQIIFSFDQYLSLPLDTVKKVCMEIGDCLIPDERQGFGVVHFKNTNHIHCHYILNYLSIYGIPYRQIYYIVWYFTKVDEVLRKYGLNEILLIA